jgi:hypothetical protein
MYLSAIQCFNNTKVLPAANQSSAAARTRRCEASISELTYSQPLTTTELKVRDLSSRHLGMTLAREERS